jgi:hypothetical protein
VSGYVLRADADLDLDEIWEYIADSVGAPEPPGLLLRRERGLQP